MFITVSSSFWQLNYFGNPRRGLRLFSFNKLISFQFFSWFQCHHVLCSSRRLESVTVKGTRWVSLNINSFKESRRWKTSIFTRKWSKLNRNKVQLLSKELQNVILDLGILTAGCFIFTERKFNLDQRNWPVLSFLMRKLLFQEILNQTKKPKKLNQI